MRCNLIVGLSLVVLFSCHANNTVNQNSKLDSSIKSVKLNVDTSKNLTMKESIGTPHQTTLDSMQGTWISEKDNNDYIIIHSHDYYEINKGDKTYDTSKSRIFFSDTCIGDDLSFLERSKLDSKRENGQYFVLSDMGDSTFNLCYAIGNIDMEGLSFFYHGKMLSFHKQK